MKSTFELFALLGSSALLSVVSNADYTCNLWQVCANHAGITEGTSPTTNCKDPSDVTLPVFTSFEPAPITDPTAINNLASACPFLDPTTPLCCNSDTAAIMVHNYLQLDGVFATDSSVCAADLKRMWCEYACNPTKADFLVDEGLSPSPDQSEDYQNVQVSIDSDYACTIYSACKGTSFIASAGVSSAIGFLNFLGYNGADYSKSYITFVQDWEKYSVGYLDSEAANCEDPVPSDGILYGYEDITNTTCSFCQKACPPPLVNDDIGFLDGFNWKLVGYTYLGFVLFTLIFQAVTHLFLRKRKLAQAEEALSMGGVESEPASRRTTDRYSKQGRPVNVTTSDASSLDLGRQKSDLDLSND